MSPLKEKIRRLNGSIDQVDFYYTDVEDSWRYSLIRVHFPYVPYIFFKDYVTAEYFFRTFHKPHTPNFWFRKFRDPKFLCHNALSIIGFDARRPFRYEIHQIP